MSSQSSKAGYWIYNSFVLRFYDLLVPGILNRFIWRCPTSRVRALYKQHLSPNHLDIGIGTGYFLAQFFREQREHQKRNSTLLGTECYSERLMLVDAHPATLDYCQKRLMKLGTFADDQIETFQVDVTKDSELSELAERILEAGPLDSVAANYLMHCLPDGLHSSEPLIAFAGRVLGSHGVFFGSMIIGEQTDKRLVTRTIAGLFRRWKIFGQRKDQLKELRSLLNKHFPICDIEVHGCVAVFTARSRSSQLGRAL